MENFIFCVVVRVMKSQNSFPLYNAIIEKDNNCF